MGRAPEADAERAPDERGRHSGDPRPVGWSWGELLRLMRSGRLTTAGVTPAIPDPEGGHGDGSPFAGRDALATALRAMTRMDTSQGLSPGLDPNSHLDRVKRATAA